MFLRNQGVKYDCLTNLYGFKQELGLIEKLIISAPLENQALTRFLPGIKNLKTLKKISES